MANSKQYERSIEAYQAALNLNPQYVRARYNLSLSLISLNRYQDAIQILIEALEIQDVNYARLRASGGGHDQLESLRSGGVWHLLTNVLQGYLQRSDLLQACTSKNLDEIKRLI